MKLGTKILKVLLMLFVFSGQVMAADGASSCDMDMHDMAMMGHSDMDMSHADMEVQKMDCCDETCAMDCSLSMVTALLENNRFETSPTNSAMFTLPQDAPAIRSLAGLYRPPITA